MNQALFPIDKLEWCIYALFTNDEKKKREYCSINTQRRDANKAQSLEGYLWAVTAFEPGKMQIRCLTDIHVINIKPPLTIAVVLVRKKDGSLRFCIDFRKLNSLTVKDSHPLPRICEMLESLAGAAHYSTFDMNSGFWQVPMSPESKQYTAFTLGSMGLYECESMPFGLCNAPPTFQRLMLN